LSIPKDGDRDERAGGWYWNLQQPEPLFPPRAFLPFIVLDFSCDGRRRSVGMITKAPVWLPDNLRPQFWVPLLQMIDC
jgi:hypothetical protein